MNKVILIGRLSKDVEIRYTQGSEPMAIGRFNIAVDRPYSANKKEREHTVDFINCITFGKRAENIKQYFKKGSKIAVEGRIQVSSYKDKNDNTRIATDVVIDKFEFCENKGCNNSNKPSNNNNSNNSFGDFYPVEDNDDILPF